MRSVSARLAGSMVTRSILALPSRTVISRRSKSTSFTRSWQHSPSLRPVPYMRETMRWETPRRLDYRMSMASP